MPSISTKILLTGLPGRGKTTAIMKIVASLPGTKLFTLTRRNRDKTVAEISQLLSFPGG